MPKRKKTALNSTYAKNETKKSYANLAIGLAVIIILVILAIVLIKDKTNIIQTSSVSTESLTEAEQDKDNAQQSFYVVKSGDSLWGISENTYKSGYNWVDIAKANKLENPGLIFAGMKLEIPKLQPKFEQSTGSSIAGVSYTVVKGDNLWEISVRAYGDGYRWVDIAKANNLVNPSIIHPGNVFKIPR